MSDALTVQDDLCGSLTLQFNEEAAVEVGIGYTAAPARPTS